jgi:hypothetical protein
MDQCINNNDYSSRTLFENYSKLANVKMNNDKYQQIIHDRISNNTVLLDELTNENVKEKEILTEFIEEYQDCEDDNFEESCDFFNSSVTLTNWFEEIESNSAIGLTFYIITSNLTKLGIRYGITVDNITTTLFPITDYIESTINVFNKDITNFGNINEKLIMSGNAVGDSNCVVPLYINKYHWIVAKKYLKLVLGQIFAHNPLGYIDKHQYFMFILFTDMTTRTFDDINMNEKWTRLYIAYLRTCAQICFDNKYNRGIRNYISMYLLNPKKRIYNTLYDYDNIICQTLSTGYIIPNSEIKLIIKYLLEEVIRRNLAKNKYNRSYFDFLSSELSTREAVDKEFDELVKEINIDIEYVISTLMSYYDMNSVLGELYKKIGSYSKFVKLLEDNYGLLPTDLTEFFLQKIKDVKREDIMTVESLYQHMDLPYRKEDMIFLILQGIEHIKNKDRIKAIDSNIYIDVNKLEEPITMEYIMNRYNIKISESD